MYTLEAEMLSLRLPGGICVGIPRFTHMARVLVPSLNSSMPGLTHRRLQHRSPTSPLRRLIHFTLAFHPQTMDWSNGEPIMNLSSKFLIS
jgi:hypothetical protein